MNTVLASEPRCSPFFRAVASVCLVVFTAWLILPTCACQLSRLLGGDGVAQAPTGQEPLAGGLPSGFEDCHCHHELPKTFEGGEALALTDGPAKGDCGSYAVACTSELVSLLPTTQSSRGPPSSFSFLGPAQGRTYLAFCVFLL